MDENRSSGEARNIGGKVQDGIGRFTGDAKTRAEGIANQVAGTVQDLYGQARDKTSELARDMEPVARQAASNFEATLEQLNTVFMHQCRSVGISRAERNEPLVQLGRNACAPRIACDR